MPKTKIESETEKRRFSRIQVTLAVELSAGGQPLVTGPARDLSLTGAFVLTPVQLKPDTACTATIVLGEGDAVLTIEASGRVVRSTPDGLAVEFQAMELEHYEHLQQVVLYNAEDTDRIESEFKSSRGLRRKG
jgi:hypothetical protein